MDKELNEISILNNTDTVPFVAFKPLLNIPWIKHGFSTRLGGVSKGYFGSMNLGFNRGDDDKLVHENFKLISQSMGINYSNIVLPDQTHTTNIRIVTKEDAGKGIVKDMDYSNIDGFITNEKNIPILSYGADCTVIFFADQKQKVIGIAHSGWRGTAKKIGVELVKKMQENYSTKLEDLIVVIGPSICKACYEVGNEVFEEFSNYYSQDELEKSFTKKNSNKFMLDLWEANRISLVNYGINESNIFISNLCTKCNEELFFSHRRDGLKRGSTAGLISIF